MPYIEAHHGTRFDCEEVETGSAVIFVNEFAGHYWFFTAESGRWLAHKKAS